jgi:hypothetical protein
LYENKNYDSKNIPKREIDKFLRDVTSTTDCECGIMASQKTGIANRDNFSISYTKNGKPVLYLHKTLENETNIIFAVELLVSVIKNSIVFDESKLAKVKAVLHTINELKKNNDRHHKNIEPFLNTYRQNKMLILQLEENVKNIIDKEQEHNIEITAKTEKTNNMEIKTEITLEETIETIELIEPIQSDSKEIKIEQDTPKTKKTQKTKTQKTKTQKPKKTQKTKTKTQKPKTQKPKKKQTAFFLWMSHHREEIKKHILETETDTDKTISIQVVQEARKRWKLLSKDDKEKWSNI